MTCILNFYCALWCCLCITCFILDLMYVPCPLHSALYDTCTLDVYCAYDMLFYCAYDLHFKISLCYDLLAYDMYCLIPFPCILSCPMHSHFIARKCACIAAVLYDMFMLDWPWLCPRLRNAVFLIFMHYALALLSALALAVLLIAAMLRWRLYWTFLLHVSHGSVELLSPC